MIVIDASAFLEVTIGSSRGGAVLDLLASDMAASPHLLDAEVLHRIVTWRKHGVLSEGAATEAVRDLRDAPIRRVDHRLLLDTAVELSAALSGYDALYAALAVQLGATLVTGDARFRDTAAGQLHLPVADLPG